MNPDILKNFGDEEKMNDYKTIEQNKKDEERKQWNDKYGKTCNTCKFPGSMGGIGGNLSGEYERECRFCTHNKALKFRWKANDQYIKDWAKIMDEIKQLAINGINSQSTDLYERILKLMGEENES